MRNLLLSGACWCLAFVSMVTGSATDVVSWGLSHRGNESIPAVSEVGAGLLKKYNGMYVGDTSKKEVYLTFDLGYEAGYTGEVLDILQEYKIKGLFFLCGNYVKQTDLILRMQNEGHQIGNHTNKHRDLPSLDEDGIRYDIKSLQLPTTSKFFRPPQGRFDEKTLRVAQEEGLRAVLWSLAIQDWQKKPQLDVAKCTQKIVERIHPGAIILLHIANSGTPALLRSTISALQEKGYTFGELD